MLSLHQASLCVLGEHGMAFRKDARPVVDMATSLVSCTGHFTLRIKRSGFVRSWVVGFMMQQLCTVGTLYSRHLAGAQLPLFPGCQEIPIINRKPPVCK